MNFLIIGFILFSLVGSVMWVMPSKRDRFLAQLRMEAKGLGFQVQMVKVPYPRAQQEIESESKSAVAYRLMRKSLAKEQANNFKSWRVVRCRTNACEGLPQGWGWSVGERTLSDVTLAKLEVLLASLPEDISGLEATPVHATAFWRESEQEQLTEVLSVVEKVLQLEN